MATLLKGAEVTAILKAKLKEETAFLSVAGVTPTLGIIRLGERPDDIAYEKSATKLCETLGVAVRQFTFSADTTQSQLLDFIQSVNADISIHGVLLFRPLPKQLDDDVIRSALCPQKDVDGITNASLAGVFVGEDIGFPPCTAQACMEILDHYGVDLKGKKVVIVGRSLVVGKPVAMMLLNRHATVTICHTRTVDMPAICRQADVLVAAAGKAGMLDESYVSLGQVVIDVGINVDEDGKLRGDVLYEDAEPVVDAITPVPGGVGTVTTTVLVKHVVEAARRAAGM